MFDREGGEEGIRYDGAGRRYPPAETGEDLRDQRVHRRRRAERLRELQRRVDRGGFAEHARVCDDAEERTQDEVADPERLRSGARALQPLTGRSWSGASGRCA